MRGFDVVSEQSVAGQPCEAPYCIGANGRCKHACVHAPHGPRTAGIGDVKSDKPGSGARYNAGKMPIELVPVWIIHQYEARQFEGEPTEAHKEALEVLFTLGQWQIGTASAVDVLAEMDDPWAACAAVFDYGRKKYAEWNWAKGMPWTVPMACAVRHALAILRGEENDAESGLPHRGHLACNLVMLAHYEYAYTAGDDRPKVLLEKEQAPE